LTLTKTVCVAHHSFCNGAVWRPREEASLWAEIAPDPRGWKRAVRIDVDVPDAVLFVSARVAEFGLLQPSFIVANPASTHAHVIYELASWVRDNNPKAMALLWKVREAYRRAFHADSSYVGKFQHNPAFPGWETWGDGRRHDLRALANAAGALFDEARSTRQPNIDSRGRNCALFDALRFEGYRMVDAFRAVRDRRGFAERLGAIAAEMNGRFAQPLSESEVGSIVGSIVRFCWNRYRSASGARQYAQTRDAYLSATEARRRRAAEMRAAGLTTAVIARSIGVSRRAVQFWNRRIDARARVRSPDSVDFSHPL
jgi:hypothetical protein